MAVVMSKAKTIWNILASLLIMAGFALGTTSLFLKLDLAKTLPEPLIVSVISLVAISAGALFLILIEAHISHALVLGTSRLSRMVTWGLLGGSAISLVNFPYRSLTEQIVVPEEFIIELNAGVPVIVVYLFLSIIVLPIVEEIYFRGLLYRLIKNSFDIFWGFALSTMLFVVGHEFSRPEHIFWMVINSAVLTYVYHKTNSALASAIAHSFWSLTWFSTYYAAHLGWF